MIHSCVRSVAVGSYLLAAAVSGCGPSAEQSDRSDIAAIERVVVGKPQRKSLVLTMTQPARIEPFEETPILAKLAGFVKQVHVDIGDKIVKGQTLVTLDIPELADDVAQREALVSQAEAQIQQVVAHGKGMQAAVETARAKIAEATAAVARATAEDNRWQREYARIKELADSGSVTEKLADETLHQLQSATAARNQAQAALQVAEMAARQAEVETVAADADRQAADVRQRVARAELARARTMLEYGEVKAPFDGVVTQRNIDTGHFVQPAGGAATKPLIVVANCDRLRVVVDVPEHFAGFVDVGDEATLAVQAASSDTTNGHVTRTSWSLSPDSRSLRVEFDIASSELKLRPGMYAACTLELARRDDVLVLPNAAVVRDGNNATCRVIKDGKIEIRAIEIGLRSGPEAEILRGLAGNDDVVLLRAETLHGGQPVQVVRDTHNE